VDLLLVDDVQFLTHRREMQAELLRLTDALQTANRQIVLTSDRPPAEIEALDERLIRRFAGGLIIDVAAPDYETRVAILRRKAEERRAAFGAGVLEAVALLDIDNVRELLGALNRLIAFQAVSETPLTPEQARTLVGGDTGTENGAVPPPAAPSPAPSPPPPPASSEFDDFLTEIAATVAQQVDAWREKVSAAILRWQGEGFRTAQLEALLEQEMLADPERALREFEEDVERLRTMRAEAVALVPDLEGSAAFRDPADLAAAQEALRQAREEGPPPPPPSPLWRLDDVVETSGNRMVLEAVRSVVGDPGARYNPLVLVGGAAVGKTHLLHALGNALAAQGGPVACLSAPEFTDELIEAIDRGTVAAWRARYRRASAFLLDDVHLVAAKGRTQDELFVLFNVLVDDGRQLVFTSAVPLAELEGVEARLRSRLEGGLVVELPPPEPAVRERVIARDIESKLGAADPALAAYVASRPAESVRAAQALLQRVLDAAAERHVAPTPVLAREVLEDAPPPSRPQAGPASGIVAPGAGATRSREKIVWEWPQAGERVIEEWR
jgi:chromosomal replication initiator protein